MAERGKHTLLVVPGGRAGGGTSHESLLHGLLRRGYTLCRAMLVLETLSFFKTPPGISSTSYHLVPLPCFSKLTKDDWQQILEPAHS